MTPRAWFVTGANRGLGRVITEQLLEKGDRVAATTRNPAQLDDLKAKYGDNLWIAELDLTDAAGIRTVVDRAFAELGRIDFIVNNAAYALIGTAEEATEEQIRHEFDTNVLGSIFVVKAALPHLRAQKGGRVIQISSAAGMVAMPGVTFYCSSKWAIEGFIEGAAQEVKPFGIEMTIIQPGQIANDFVTNGVLAPAIEAYADTPGAMMRGMYNQFKAAGPEGVKGCPHKMARVIIASGDQSPAPLRISLGADTYGLLTEVHKNRAAALEEQKEVCLSTDVDA